MDKFIEINSSLD